MNHRILISDEIRESSDILENSKDYFLPLQPCFSVAIKRLDSESYYLCWTLKPEVHESIKGAYSIDFQTPYWVFEFDELDDALLFKLTWGGS